MGNVVDGVVVSPLVSFSPKMLRLNLSDPRAQSAGLRAGSASLSEGVSSVHRTPHFGTRLPTSIQASKVLRLPTPAQKDDDESDPKKKKNRKPKKAKTIAAPAATTSAPAPVSLSSASSSSSSSSSSSTSTPRSQPDAKSNTAVLVAAPVIKSSDSGTHMNASINSSVFPVSEKKKKKSQYESRKLRDDVTVAELREVLSEWQEGVIRSVAAQYGVYNKSAQPIVDKFLASSVQHLLTSDEFRALLAEPVATASASDSSSSASE